MNLVFNERIKLTASWLNALATGLIVAGAFAPAAALLYGLSALQPGGAAMVALVLGCFVMAGCLHWVGWALLGKLRE